MNIRLSLAVLFLMPPSFVIAAPAYVLESDNYSSVSIENSILVPTAQFSKIAGTGVEVHWANGVFYAKRQGLIVKILKKNVEPVLQNLSRSEIEAVIKSKKPIRLSRNAAGEYNIEYLLVL